MCTANSLKSILIAALFYAFKKLVVGGFRGVPWGTDMAREPEFIYNRLH
jgi:hypothetical protein